MKTVFSRSIILLFCGLSLISCGLRFSGGPQDNPFPPDIKTIEIHSATNNTTVTGIETELTNDLRSEFALGTLLTPVRSGGNVLLKPIIASYDETTSTFTADGKELTRMGTLQIKWLLEKADTGKIIKQRELTASNSYNVTDTITGTLTNRRLAISRMIKDLIPRIHRSLYDNF